MKFMTPRPRHAVAWPSRSPRAVGSRSSRRRRSFRTRRRATGDALGWMQGFPPPPDKVIRFADGSSYRFPQLRWTFSNYRRLVPTGNVSRGLGGALCRAPSATTSTP